MSSSDSAPIHRRLEGPDGAPVVLLLNSLGASAQMWDVVAAALQGEYRVLRLDYRGHGATPWRAGAFTFDDLVGDVLGVLSDEGIETFHVAGVSLGGMLALALAARHPDRVLSTTPMCCGARLGRADWVERGRLVRADGVEGLVDVVLPRWFTEQARHSEPGIVARYLDDLRACEPAAYAAFADMLADVDLFPELGRITAPAIVVSAADDVATPPELQEQIAAATPGAQRVIVPEAAHLITAEASSAVAELLHRVLSDKVTIV